MAKAKPNKDILDDLFGADEEKPRRRRRVAAPATPGAGPSGPAMSGGPSGPAMSGGPSGPAMSGGPAIKGKGAAPAAPTSRRKRLNKDEMKSLYG
ncbi:MAG: hypothetical protein GX574_00200 [Lentisphaerae bacterium]|nr:hypothetical protein [Lentisphaerota bacterium]HQL87351.1 hypothetical protein [Lentisphaeria bacterium]